VSVFPTKHAIGLQTADGLEVLIHMGIDTVQMKNEGFHVFVEEGQTIHAGDKLAQMNLDVLRDEGKEATVMVIFTNSEKVEQVNVLPKKSVHPQEKIGTIKL
ncbi:MAG: PTS glucose transporter subunit IIA, partial [Enterococcus sp.]